MVKVHSKKKTIRKIDCEEAVRRLFDYIDGYLPVKSLTELESHLESCRGCMGKLEFQQTLKSRISKIKPAEVSEKLEKKIEILLKNL